MNARMKAMLESKRKERRRLAGLPFTEKVALLERLRDRELAIAAGRPARRTGPASLHPPGGRETG